MNFLSFLPIYKFVLVSCKISGFLNFHVSHLNHEMFKLCLQNTLNMSKMTKVYFGVLQCQLSAGPLLNLEAGGDKNGA